MILKYTNARGESIGLDQEFPYKFLYIDDTGGFESDMQTQNIPFMDGVVYVDSMLKEKPIEIGFALKDYDTRELARHRRALSRIFNPKLGQGKLEYNSEDGIREIQCVPESSPFFPKGKGNQSEYVQKGTINLIAPYPYWQDPERVPHPLQAYVGNFTLPFSFPFELGVEGDRTQLINKGDVPAPVQIDIHGPTTRPKITNHTTGQFIQLNTTIGSDEIAHIDTTPGQKRVEIYRGGTLRRAFGYLSQESDFWMLDVGENDVEYIAEAGNKYALVNVTWNHQFIGI